MSSTNLLTTKRPDTMSCACPHCAEAYLRGVKDGREAMRVTWDEVATKRLLELLPTTPYAEIAVILGRSKNAIQKRVNTLGIRGPSHFWRQEQTDFLAYWYCALTDREMGEIIGRTERAVANRAKRMGLSRRLDYPEDVREVLELHEIIKRTIDDRSFNERRIARRISSRDERLARIDAATVRSGGRSGEAARQGA